MLFNSLLAAAAPISTTNFNDSFKVLPTLAPSAPQTSILDGYTPTNSILIPAQGIAYHEFVKKPRTTHQAMVCATEFSPQHPGQGYTKINSCFTYYSGDDPANNVPVQASANDLNVLNDKLKAIVKETDPAHRKDFQDLVASRPGPKAFLEAINMSAGCEKPMYSSDIRNLNDLEKIHHPSECPHGDFRAFIDGLVLTGKRDVPKEKLAPIFTALGGIPSDPNIMDMVFSYTVFSGRIPGKGLGWTDKYNYIVIDADRFVDIAVEGGKWVYQFGRYLLKEGESNLKPLPHAQTSPR